MTAASPLAGNSGRRAGEPESRDRVSPRTGAKPGIQAKSAGAVIDWRFRQPDSDQAAELRQDAEGRGLIRNRFRVERQPLAVARP